MIIFGWGKRTFKELGTTERVQCGRCNNVRPWKYKKMTTWFTLFFIPVIPYEMKYFKECPICKEAVLVNRAEAMGSEDKQGQANDGLTDVQRNYLKQMKELKVEE